MKKIILLIGMALISVFGSAQMEWALPSSKWTYNGNKFGISNVEITVEKDTLVHGKTVQKLIKTGIFWDPITEQVDTSYLGYELTYIEDSVVYLYIKSEINSFDTLFAFNATVGDCWNLKCYDNFCRNDAIVKVINKGTIDVNGTQLMYMDLKYEFDSMDVNPEHLYLFEDIVIERIGSTKNYFLPWHYVYGMFDAEEGTDLRCYSDELTGTFRNSGIDACDYLVNIDSKSQTETEIYPNPAIGFITLEFDVPKKRQINIYDPSGKMILRTESSGISSTIFLHNLNTGIFIVRISDDMFSNNYLISKQKK